MHQKATTKRECQLLVLSPRARTELQLSVYRPFRGRSLIAIIRDVAAGVSNQKVRRYDEHTPFRGFFFGRKTLDEGLIDDLRKVPSSLVDCEIYATEQAEAASAARVALSHFADGEPTGAKLIALACTQEALVDGTLAFQLARNDETLFAQLWIDLCGGGFNRVGQVMTRRWGD
jgi:hypothetical protein